MPGRPDRQYDHAFAVLRFDRWLAEGQLTDERLEAAVTVKAVVWTREKAEREVARLNEINRDKDCHYFHLLARVERKPAE